MAKDKKKISENEFQLVQKKRSVMPIVLVLLLAAVFIPISVYGIRYVIELRSKAAPTEDPKNVMVTNITDTSVSVFWTTFGTKTEGYIKYGVGGNVANVGFDVRDQESAPGQYNLHYIDIHGLTSDTVYYYIFIIGGKEYKNGDKYYEFTTGSTLTSLQTPFPIIGDVDDIVNGGGEENIVFVYAMKGGIKTSTLSVMTSSKRYAFDFANFRTSDFLSSFNDWEDTELYFSAYSSSGKMGTVRTKIVQL